MGNPLQDTDGLLMDTCNNVVWQGLDDFNIPTPKLSPPVGGDLPANVVITGDSSGIVFKDCIVAPGAGALGTLPEKACCDRGLVLR